VILKEGYKPEENIKEKIIESIRIQIGPIAAPKDIYFVAKLPKTRSGKIMRRILKAIIQDRPVGDITTLEDEASVEEIKIAYEEFKRILEK
jgi:acetyl-CoA synthetase